MSKLPYS